MRDFSEENLTHAVLARTAPSTDPRLQQVMASLVRHLHGFVREVELTEAEWFEGIRFLTATGQICSDSRQEFILLSDTLGVSMLVDAINHRRAREATANTVLGPFHVDGAPWCELGVNMAAGIQGGTPCWVTGRVINESGEPIVGAELDVWQVRPDRLYDVQDPEAESMQLRVRLRTDDQGRYFFRSVVPVSYAIPDDGPVGGMLEALGRHPWRPAHIHFIVRAAGYEQITTHLFVEGDPYLDSDAVFGVKNTLVVSFQSRPAGPTPDGPVMEVDYQLARYDFCLAAAAS